ncbi:NAD(P)-dependent oxidoreductase [Elongatibacter sediminis]|uniref:NAD(P)H-binding protein n=1 Tax=Elongatibacter sediminis TaxID=3119006 RepID=A0AAW9R8Q2_9GAMM
MNITVFGARGSVGSRITHEAVARGHSVTAATRQPPIPGRESLTNAAGRLQYRAADATCPEDVMQVIAGQDAIIAATRPLSGHEPELIASTRTLLDAAAATGTRLLISGGAATLKVPDSGIPVLEDTRYLPPAARPIAMACAEQLALCQLNPASDWTYFSPAASLFSGERTGRFRLGTDDLIVDEQGASRLSLEDLAVAVLDEVEQIRFRRSRFTAAY